MMKLLCVLLLGWALPIFAEEDFDRVQSLLARIEQIPDNPSFEQVVRLAVLSGGDFEGPGYDEVRKKAWERLRKVPDFAEKFDTNLREEREKWVSGEESPSTYNRNRAYAFHAMRRLPHPSVVKVVGGYLSDAARPGYDGGDEASRIAYSVIPSNAVLSAEVLGQLIEKPPIAKHWDDYKEEDAKTWELWFEQVKAGTRTFRFKGDPQDYNLQGSVSKSIEPTGLATKREDRGPLPLPSEAKPAKGFPMAALLAACVVLALAAWYAFRRKMRPA